MPPNCDSTSEEHRLLQRAARGDEQAFAQLYKALASPVFTYLVRLTGDGAAAEDLLQEVFLAVWQRAGDFRGEASVRVWVLRIAHHKAVSWWRRQRSTENVNAVEELVGPEGEVEEAALAAWEYDRLVNAVRQLSPKHREVIELVFGQQLSYAEVAAVLGCPVGTVKSRVSYALRALRHLLRDMQETEHGP